MTKIKNKRERKKEWVGGLISTCKSPASLVSFYCSVSLPREWACVRLWERERERDGIEGSHTSPRPSANPNPNPNRTETAGTVSERWIPPPPVIARRRSSDERRCHRQSPLRGQELPQGRSLQGLLRFPLPFPFSRENACLVPEKISLVEKNPV